MQYLLLINTWSVIFVLTYLNFLSTFFSAVSWSSIQILAVRSKIPLLLYSVRQKLLAFSIAPPYDFFNLTSSLSLINSKLCLQVFSALIRPRTCPLGQSCSKVDDLSKWICPNLFLTAVLSTNSSLSQYLEEKKNLNLRSFTQFSRLNVKVFLVANTKNNVKCWQDFLHCKPTKQTQSSILCRLY